jgi:hypothetical protein
MNNYLCSVCGTPCIYTGGYREKPQLACDCAKNGHWVEGFCASHWEPDNGAKPIPIEDYLPKKANANV